MAHDIGRDAVLELRSDGAQLVEVLSRKAYEGRHLPGATSLPLAELNRQTAGRLRRDRPVVLYCADRQ